MELLNTGDIFLGYIKVRSVPPPRTVKAVKGNIAKLENIKDRESTSFFLTPCSQLPMDYAEKVTILDGTGAGSISGTPSARYKDVKEAHWSLMGGLDL